jgi:phosphoglycerate dehydrogenase-like enzyme
MQLLTLRLQQNMEEVVNTRYESTPTIEFTWAMILGLARKIWIENASLRAGGWQTSVGLDLRGKTLGLLVLGNIGSKVAEIAKAFECACVESEPDGG